MSVMQPRDLLLKPLPGIAHVAQGDDLAELTLKALRDAGVRLEVGDVLVFCQKVVSKTEGRAVALASVTPSERAIELGRETGKDARVVELILQESHEVLRHRPGLIIVAHRLGFVLANAGIDPSNVGDADQVLLLPVDPDASAARIREGIRRSSGVDIGVLIIDSIGRAWRQGTIGTAVGASGIPTLIDLRGRRDLHGRPLESTEIGFADELAAAASLVMGQADEGFPIVLARGVPYDRNEGSVGKLVRPKAIDLFR